MLEVLKAILFGIIEGITEWLPISSTGHMILLDEIFQLNVSEEFYEMFQVIIQLGAIAAVLVLFWEKLNPYYPKKTPQQRQMTWSLWVKVIIAVITSAVLGLTMEERMDEIDKEMKKCANDFVKLTQLHEEKNQLEETLMELFAFEVDVALLLPEDYLRYCGNAAKDAIRRFAGTVIPCGYELDEGSFLYLREKTKRMLENK